MNFNYSFPSVGDVYENPYGGKVIIRSISKPWNQYHPYDKDYYQIEYKIGRYIECHEWRHIRAMLGYNYYNKTKSASKSDSPIDEINKAFAEAKKKIRM